MFRDIAEYWFFMMGTGSKNKIFSQAKTYVQISDSFQII
jgi:hypothetical protein